MTAYLKLERLFKELHALRGCAAVLRWDAAVMMPEGAAALRAEQLAALESVIQRQLIARRVSLWLQQAEARVEQLNDWQRANLREMRRQWLFAAAIPRRLQNKFARQTVLAEKKWREAREKNDFKIFAPGLEHIVDLVREKGEVLGRELDMPAYQALMQEFDPDRSQAQVDKQFGLLQAVLPEIIDAILTRQQQSQAPINTAMEIAQQRMLCERVMRQLGFDFSAGRLDESAHPFTEGMPGDIRITTHFDEKNFFTGLLGVLHECGHAIYDKHLPVQWLTQPVGRDRGMSLHEGAALLMEMMVGRSEAFAHWLTSILPDFMPAPPDYAQVRYGLLRVAKSPIRIDADEVTYLPHITLRYNIEKRLLEGSMTVAQIPQVWNEGMQKYFGFAPLSDAEGCLQDIHWSLGLFGYFHCYALGLLFAAEVYTRLRREIPELEAAMMEGDFEPILRNLKEKFYMQGAFYTQDVLIKRLSGDGLSAETFLGYLRDKYLAI